MRRKNPSDWGVAFPLALAFMVTLIITVVVVSPWIMHAAISTSKMDWSTLGNMGQAYGGAAAVITALALSGVAASLILQMRDSRATLEQMRTYQLELVRMGLDHPEVRWARTVPGAEISQDKLNVMSYINLWVMYWFRLYRFKGISIVEIRMQMHDTIFSTDVGREYWEIARGFFDETQKGRRERLVLKAIEEEYHRALSAGPPKFKLRKKAQGKLGPFINCGQNWQGSLFVTGAAIGVLAYFLARRSQN
jgi:hypothetical protein